MNDVNAERVAIDHELPPLATSAGTARRLLREAFATANEAAVESAQLAVSEIVTNALVHAGTTMRLRVATDGRVLRVELSDGSPQLPRRRGHAPLTATGRGLHLVTELVDRWGAYPVAAGKVVWFEIADQAEGDAEIEVAAPRLPALDGAVEVHLLNLPLLMHAAWQEHAAALLREYMLFRLGDDPEALENHAAASDALSVLLEQVPGPDLGDLPEAIMASATEPGVSLPELVLRVERSRVDHVVKLHQMLDEATALADKGELLTPPSQPEIRLMRHWICEQIWLQSEGGRPVPWVSPTDAEAPGSAEDIDWDPSGVDTSSDAVLAADDTNRIVAISQSALAALGYEDRDGLVGQRLVRIIPWRFHQAHVAGFTLHLMNGRDPLLGHRVAVPVIRADDSELEVEVRVDAVPLPGGRKVFIAELFL